MSDDSAFTHAEKYIISNQERQEQQLEKLSEDVTKLRVAVEGLRVKSSLWGMMGGTVPVLLTSAKWTEIIKALMRG